MRPAMTAYSSVSIPVSSLRKFLIVFIRDLLFGFLGGCGLCPDLRTWPRAKRCTGTAGVISGTLSDRFLPITATFLVRGTALQCLCQWRNVRGFTIALVLAVTTTHACFLT